jgi:hypothetical protein
MHQVLSELAVTAEATGVKLGDTIHSGEPDRSPHGPRCTLAEYHGRPWCRARPMRRAVRRSQRRRRL